MMARSNRPSPAALVIFGAAGDLTQRKLVPALYSLFLDEYLPEKFSIIGMDKQGMSDEDFRERLRQGVNRHSRRGPADADPWKAFAGRLCFTAGDLGDARCYQDLARWIDAMSREWGEPATAIFYLAVPPALIGTITRNLGEAGLSREAGHARIVVEKPFGHDLASAHALNMLLTSVFTEPQIYRIDHYLGKETVQNILALRFANAIFEPIWNRRYIDHVQITVAEEIGVGHRGGYYEHAGALRDMVQNHLSQVLCLIAMEPPVSFEADEVRNKKVDVLRALRPIPRDRVYEHAVRGQYGPGWIRGERVPGYRAEDSVDRASPTETFAAVKYTIDNWRWQGVPFYLRTGKRLPTTVSEVTIEFKPIPHQFFPSTAIGEWQPNRLTLRIQPNEGILLGFQAKQPAQDMRLSTVSMRFHYAEAFQAPPPDAYETLLLDVMQGDTTQFMRADQIEIAWSVIMPILEAWESVGPGNFPNYAAGSWGPEAASALLARDGRSWFLPTVGAGDHPAEVEREELARGDGSQPQPQTVRKVA